MIRLAAIAAVSVAACGATEQSLIAPSQIDDDAIPAPLTSQPGDPLVGETVFSDRESGHCVLCHAVSGLDVEFQGDVGPDLSTVGDRLSPGQLRLRVVDYQLVRPGALMPSYYRIHNLHQVGTAYEGETILSAQDIEDIVAYLGAQKVGDDDGS